MEKFYTKYDSECITILAIEIIKSLLLEGVPMYIDLYYNAIVEIYEDYKKHDNNNVSLLTSIHNYIESNEDKILSKIKYAFENI